MLGTSALCYEFWRLTIFGIGSIKNEIFQGFK
ncbi:unnamed protein product [Larinioides sclopetarius]|uniref:Uncharacterized protein n=1 Tax=Larinioides sclopetarius TaxID=280406 RepID=A0AAV2BWH6_9ARAC